MSETLSFVSNLISVEDITMPIIVGPGGKPDFFRDFTIPDHIINSIISGTKKIRVSPSELTAAAGKISGIAEAYTATYSQLMQTAQSMGNAWDGADNLAFVEQISGFCDDLRNMTDKLNAVCDALRTIAQNYENRQNDNIAQVKKLAN